MQWVSISVGLSSLRSGCLRVPGSDVDKLDFPVAREEAGNPFSGCAYAQDRDELV
jgi:hypothetical protein